MSPYPAEVRWTLALNTALVAQAEPAYDGSDGYFPIQGDRVVAYDLRRGTQRWMVSARPLSAPAVSGGLLFLEQTGSLSALHVKDGSVAWTVPFTEKLAVPLVSDKSRLVAATPTTILSFRAEDGMLQWRREVGAKPHRAAIARGRWGVCARWPTAASWRCAPTTARSCGSGGCPSRPTTSSCRIRNSSSDRTTTTCTV